LPIIEVDCSWFLADMPRKIKKSFITNIEEAHQIFEIASVAHYLAVHSHGQSELEIFVKHFSSERDSLAEHLDGHQTEGLAVHQEAIGVDGRQAVDLGHVTDPGLDVFAQPRTGIWNQNKFTFKSFVL
jgi:hypothetical protein